MSQISMLIVFSSKKLFSWTYLLKKTLEGQKYEIRFKNLGQSDKYKINEVKIISKLFYQKKLGLLEITQESHAQNLKNMHIKYLQRTFALPAIQCKW